MAFSFPFRFVTNEKCKTRRLLREQVNEIFSLKPIFPSAFPGKRVFISLSFTICYCSVVCFCLQISISMQSKDSVNGCYQRRVDLKIVGFLRLLEHFSQKLIFRVVFFFFFIVVVVVKNFGNCRPQTHKNTNSITSSYKQHTKYYTYWREQLFYGNKPTAECETSLRTFHSPLRFLTKSFAAFIFMPLKCYCLIASA